MKKDPQLSNLYYIPLEFLSPKAELISQIVSFGKVDYLADAIEKYLLNNDLVKDKFITSEQVFSLSVALKEALNVNNFANAFSTSKINEALLPKIIFDFLYYLSHDNTSDTFRSIIINIFERIKAKINASGTTLDEKKQYLISEVNNFYNIINSITGINISQYIDATTLVNISNDPIKFIDGLELILTSFDTHNFSELAHS
ncbi:UNVERIFIED_CONTAM: hypothetical protein O8I53_06495 [Campylobacter lari]